MVKHGLLVTVAGALSIAWAGSAPAQTSKITPQLASQLAATPAGAQVPAIITLDRQVETDGTQVASATLIRRLRATAATTQREVVAELDGPSTRFWLVNAIATRVSADEAADLAANPAVRQVDVDLPVTVTADGAQSGSALNGWGVTAVRAQGAWSSYAATGRGVRIGSIDTGVDTSSAQVASSVVAWKDFVAGAAAPYDDNGHGTHTIGTMAGRNTDGITIGVAPDADVVVAKAMNAQGVSTASTLLAAAQWMTDPDGNPATADFPTVINNSWTTASDPHNEWFRPMVQTWVAMGITPVFAAGNNGGAVGSPSSYPEVITVGATDQANAVWNLSSRGVSTWTVNGMAVTVGKPDVVAPGVAVTSVVPGGYAPYSGTSMAAPHVAGAIALMKQARPGLTTEEIRSILRSTATDVDAPGVDLASGAGLINAHAAVARTGAPAVQAAPRAAEPAPQSAPADVATAPGVVDAPNTIHSVSVVRQGSRYVVRGRVTRTAKITFRAVSTTGRDTITRRTTSGGTFRMIVPARRSGTYNLTLTATAAGRRAETIQTRPAAGRTPVMRTLNVTTNARTGLVVRGTVGTRATVTARTGAKTARAKTRKSFRMTVPTAHNGYRVTMQFTR